MNEKKIYKPRPSAGWIWVGLIGLVPLATGLALMITQGLSGPFLITILVTIPIGLGFLLIAIFFPTMRYEIKGSRLTLRYGPLLRYTIELGQINIIRNPRGYGFYGAIFWSDLFLLAASYMELLPSMLRQIRSMDGANLTYGTASKEAIELR